MKKLKKRLIFILVLLFGYGTYIALLSYSMKKQQQTLLPMVEMLE